VGRVEKKESSNRFGSHVQCDHSLKNNICTARATINAPKSDGTFLLWQKGDSRRVRIFCSRSEMSGTSRFLLVGFVFVTWRQESAKGRLQGSVGTKETYGTFSWKDPGKSRVAQVKKQECITPRGEREPADTFKYCKEHEAEGESIHHNSWNGKRENVCIQIPARLETGRELKIC